MNGFLDVPGGRLESLDLPGDPARPTLVLLHEGLGSVGLWRAFPYELHDATGMRTLVFSRFGHGRSSPPPRPRTPTFMHKEAREVVPAVLSAASVERSVLVGHSDGGSIALIHAAEHEVAGLVLLAPHVFVEDVGIASITATRDVFERGDLRQRMARHHDDPALAFHGWCDVWLDPAFRDWNLEGLLPAVTAPTLLIQGRDDEYGTLAQIESIARGLGGPSETLVVAGGHAPHLDRPEEVLGAVAAFVAGL
jgi:pimeloyl-ACP methyl ester carboxylesterase